MVAADLEAAEERITDELGVELCFRDPGVAEFGLRNALFPIGDQFLEVVSPTQTGTTAGRQIERRGGDSGYMVIVEVDDLDPVRQRLAALGTRVVFEAAVPGIVGLHLHPADVGGAILSIDTMHPGSNFHRENSYWQWSGPDWQEYINTNIAQAITAIEIQAENPDAVAEVWGRVLDRPVDKGRLGPEVALDNNTLRFVGLRDDRGLGISAIDILPQDRKFIHSAAQARGLVDDGGQIELCGVRINLI